MPKLLRTVRRRKVQNLSIEIRQQELDEQIVVSQVMATGDKSEEQRKKRGRPKKSQKEQPREVEANKKRGRSKKIIDNQEADVEKARRGRPPNASLALQYDDEKRKAKKKRTKKH